MPKMFLVQRINQAVCMSFFFTLFFQHVAQLKWMLLPTIFFQRLITRGLVGWPYRFSTSSFYQLSNIHHPGASLKTAPHTSLQREKTNAILNENQREPWYSGWVDLPVGGFGRWWWYEVGWIYQYSRGWLVVEGYMGLGGSPWWQYRAWWNQVGSFDSPQQWVLRLKGIKVKDKVRYILLHLLPDMTFSLNTFERLIWLCFLRCVRCFLRCFHSVSSLTLELCFLFSFSLFSFTAQY